MTPIEYQEELDHLAEKLQDTRTQLAESFGDNLQLRRQIKVQVAQIARLEADIRRLKYNEYHRGLRARKVNGYATANVTRTKRD